MIECILIDCFISSKPEVYSKYFAFNFKGENLNLTQTFRMVWWPFVDKPVEIKISIVTIWFFSLEGLSSKFKCINIVSLDKSRHWCCSGLLISNFPFNLCILSVFCNWNSTHLECIFWFYHIMTLNRMNAMTSQKS